MAAILETEAPTEFFGDDFFNDDKNLPLASAPGDDFFADDDEAVFDVDSLPPVPTTVIPEMMTPESPPKPTIMPIPVAPIPIPPLAIQKPRVPTESPTSFTSSPTSRNGSWFANPWPGSGQSAPAPVPTPQKTRYPTWSPTEPQPTYSPTITAPPTYRPTLTYFPTVSPTKEKKPTDKPSELVTEAVLNDNDKDDRPKPEIISASPTLSPTNMPISNPPTNRPTKNPTMKPTITPKQTDSAGLKGDLSRNKFVGFQSNWGPTHPGSMIYDFTRNAIYMTGTTVPRTSSPFQRSTCFAGELPIADIESWKTVDDPLPPWANEKFTVPDSLKEKEIMGCNLIYHDDTNRKNDVLFVGGVVEAEATERSGNIEPFLNYYDRSRNKPGWKLDGKAYEYEGVGTNFDLILAPVKYPIAMTSGSLGKNEDTMMVLYVGSDDDLLTEEYIENGDTMNAKNSKNTLLPPGVGMADPSKYAIPKRGTQFFMSINEYVFDDEKKLKHNWGDNFRQDSGPSRSNGETFPTGVANRYPKSREYIFAGHVRGDLPVEFVARFPIDANGKRHMDDLDGWVATLKFPQDKPSWVRSANLRFSSIEMDPHLDDFVHGLCMGPVTENGKINVYYVVGSTYGTMPPAGEQTEITTNILSGGSDHSTDGDKVNKLSAWVSKIDAYHEKVLWTTQLYATSDLLTFDGGKTEAFGCHIIDSDSSRMYVGGTVYGGGIMNSNEKSEGSDDVWVAQLMTEDGSIRWIRQIGSSGRDRIARTNGVEVDINGHAIIYGETTGELYRTRPGEAIHNTDGSSTDIFVTTLDIESGMSESTIESDRAFEIVRNSSLTGVGIFLAIVVLCCCVVFRRNLVRKKLASRGEVDGVLSDASPAFKDEPNSGENGYHDTTNGGYNDTANGSNGITNGITNGPPSEAFQDNKVV